MVIVVFLCYFFAFKPPLTLHSFIGQRLCEVLFCFVSGVHHSHFLSIDTKIRLVCLSVGDSCLLRREEFDEGEIFESPSEFVANLANIAHRSERLECL